jgi:hypothetical protein
MGILSHALIAVSFIGLLWFFCSSGGEVRVQVAGFVSTTLRANHPRAMALWGAGMLGENALAYDQASCTFGRRSPSPGRSALARWKGGF